MSHHVHTRRDDYVRLLKEFVSGACDGENFKKRFLHLRRRDLDDDAQMKRTWGEPHDEKLLAALKRGDISDEEFTRRWHDLWQYPRGDRWLVAFADLFTWVERFEASNTALRTRDEARALEGGGREYVDEAELRGHVRETLELLGQDRASPGNAS